MNQFFYTRVEGEKTYHDSFNVNLVIRSVENEDGTVLVLLNDLHERSRDVPDINVKTNKVVGMKRQRDVFQSEITLSKEDGIRFRTLNEKEWNLKN
jgi:hypothetical protein